MILAHAYTPTGGNIHFNTDSEWTTKKLLSVATHFIGVSLGAMENDRPDSILNNEFSVFEKVNLTDLSYNDRDEIMNIFGPPLKPVSKELCESWNVTKMFSCTLNIS